jgi:cytidylate kinase
MVADRLGFMHLDTGAMYRAMTLKIIRSGIATGDAPAVSKLLESTTVSFGMSGNHPVVLLDGVDVSDGIRTPDVTAGVSAVSAIRRVRTKMVSAQQASAIGKNVVVEGRDIGTVVFPDAELKIFMVANIESRARRRLMELKSKGIDANLYELAEAIRKRDELDSTRDESPLRKAADALEIDTSDLTIDQQVDDVVALAEERLKGR